MSRRAIDRACIGCGAAIGEWCPGFMCRARIVAAIKETRDENIALRLAHEAKAKAGAS